MKKVSRFLALALVVCMLPTLALATSYSGWKVYNDEVDMTGVVLKKGDKLAKSSGISVEIYYFDANGNEVGDGGDTIKAVKIGDETVTEWVIKGKYGSVMQIGNLVKAAIAFNLMPSYMAADADGYYTLSAKTYDAFNVVGKKLKATGTVVVADAETTVIAIADGMFAALTTDQTFDVNDRVVCKGTVTGSVDYEGSTIVAIACDEASVQMYDPLQKGDRGEAVTEMKLRMQELGYFTAGASLSDQYNDTCVERVKQFQQKNGLTASGEADVDTLNLLFSDNAIAK